MLATTVKPTCDGLYGATKKLLVWVVVGKRKNYNGRYSEYQENEFSGRRLPYSKHRDNYGFSNRRFPYSKPKSFINPRINDFLQQKKDINWEEVDLKPFSKNFYSPHPNLASRSQSEVEEFWNRNEIKINGNNCPVPVFSFEEAGWPDTILNVLRDLKFDEPTPIQSQGWPIALSGLNMVGVGRTGSGKTLGFLLPGIIHIKNQPKLSRGEGPIALVLSPTRELVQQTESVANHFTKVMNIKLCSLYGGKRKLLQIEKIREGVELCLATPGRLIDLLNSNYTNLHRCTYLVIDEADTMLDMGFEPQLKAIVEQVRPDRQVLMWSATWPPEIQSLSKRYINNYIQLTVGSVDLAANPNITQNVHVCEERDKRTLLCDIIQKEINDPENKILIFASTKIRVDNLDFWLRQKGFDSDSIHSGKKQIERQMVLQRFRRKKRVILVATDVAARGLDVNDIKTVINFDCPNTVETYIHRIGRTARHNSKGVSHIFITGQDNLNVKGLIKILQKAGQEVPESLERISRR